ncbi:hypothetical protein [Oceanicaulis sp. UBA2681]|uniref:hypothetical protein n=1 Tax=Oceanicaulis sp. UBA2681 TaxID=1947007 RepID=UPI00257EDB0E|nr:hypothetical protein [Oceanicaulis sp. UBA2681]
MNRKQQKGIESLDRGHFAELSFERYCTSSSIIANKFNRDLTGKDFLIEIPSNHFSPIKAMDVRPAAFKAGVQVKAINENSKYIRLKLSTCEYITKSVEPTFLFIVILSPEYKILSTKIMHFEEKHLSKILRALRLATSKNKLITNRYVSISISDATSIDIEKSDGIKNFLDLMPPNIDDYAYWKIQSLKSIGYNDDRYSGTISFDCSNYEEFVDGLLGIRPLKVCHMEIKERRFNIDLPIEGRSAPFTEAETAELSVSPRPKAIRLKCEGKATNREISVEIDADLIIPAIPDIRKEFLKFIIKGSNFSIDISKSYFNFNIDIDALKIQNIRILYNDIKIINALNREACILTLEEKNVRGMQMEMGPFLEDDPQLAQYEKILEAANYLLTYCGQSEVAEGSLSDLFENAEKLVTFANVARGIESLSGTAEMEDSSISEGDITDEDLGVYVTAIKIGGNWYGLAFDLNIRNIDFVNDGSFSFEFKSDRFRSICLLSGDLMKAHNDFYTSICVSSNARLKMFEGLEPADG